jgi:hypothetical protein
MTTTTMTTRPRAVQITNTTSNDEAILASYKRMKLIAKTSERRMPLCKTAKDVKSELNIKHMLIGHEVAKLRAIKPARAVVRRHKSMQIDQRMMATA